MRAPDPLDPQDAFKKKMDADARAAALAALRVAVEQMLDGKATPQEIAEMAFNAGWLGAQGVEHVNQALNPKPQRPVIAGQN